MLAKNRKHNRKLENGSLDLHKLNKESLAEGLMKIIPIRAFSKRSYKNNEACVRFYSFE